MKTPQLWAGFLRYPSLRDAPLSKTAAGWLRGRRLDDGYGALWRVRDGLYDLDAFASRHPGGSQWLRVTRGTDITEAFVTSHLNPAVDVLLAKYHVRDVTTPRNSPYTFAHDGFYMTLKRNVWTFLKENVDDGRGVRSVDVQNGLLGVLALSFALTVYWCEPVVAVVCGLLLAANVNCAHNFYHQRDSWRMYVWDLSLLSSFEWRITHALSHHGFTNTVLS